MEEFIVLGLVPGTSIQIDFFAWLKMATILMGIMIVVLVHRRLSKRLYTFTPLASEQKGSKIFVSEPFDHDTTAAL